jgi:transcriptional regulator with XRE-family HTH domain
LNSIIPGSPQASFGERLRNARLWNRLTQRELAETSGVSLSLVRKLEQGDRESASPERLHRLASALGVTTSSLLGTPPPVPDQAGALWTPARDAILSAAPASDGHVTAARTSRSLDNAARLYYANRYGDLSQALPLLIADAENAPPLLRSRVHQLAGAVMVQTRNREAAAVSLYRSVADAEAGGDDIDAAASVVTLCWLLLVEGRFAEVTALATRWADRVEPRMSTATVRELSVWGWLLLRGSAAAVRDNRPGEAADMMRLAAAAGAGIGREQGVRRMYWTNLGPATVAMKQAENAGLNGQPDVALRLAREVPPGLRTTSDNRNRHLLDVVLALVDLGRRDDALDILSQLRAEAGPWLAEQRLARDLFGRIAGGYRRRAWTGQMGEVAAAVRYRP